MRLLACPFSRQDIEAQAGPAVYARDRNIIAESATGNPSQSRGEAGAPESPECAAFRWEATASFAQELNGRVTDHLAPSGPSPRRPSGRVASDVASHTMVSA